MNKDYLAAINAALCAINAALFVAGGSPISLGVAVFSGLMAFVIAVTP
jgi:hypothetical protein